MKIMRSRIKIVTLLCLTIAIALGADVAWANPLLPGQGPVAADTFTIGYSGTQVAYTNSAGFPYPTFSTSGSSVTGEDLMQVVSDPSNVFCTGCLDFILQVNNDITSANIVSVALTGYAGYSTDVGYDTDSVGGGFECGPGDNGYCNDGVDGQLDTVSRDATGNTITFNLDSPGLVANQSSVGLVVETNATSFVSASDLSVYGSDGSSALNVGGIYSPPALVTTTPEPDTLVYLASGMLGLLGLAMKRKSALAR